MTEILRANGMLFYGNSGKDVALVVHDRQRHIGCNEASLIIGSGEDAKTVRGGFYGLGDNRKIMAFAARLATPSGVNTGKSMVDLIKIDTSTYDFSEDSVEAKYFTPGKAVELADLYARIKAPVDPRYLHVVSAARERMNELVKAAAPVALQIVFGVELMTKNIARPTLGSRAL